MQPSLNPSQDNPRDIRSDTPDDTQGDIPYAALEQAAEWYAVLRAGDIDNAERERWRAWLAADAAHRLAWARVEAISDGFALAREAPEAAGSALDAARRLRGRRKLIKTMVLAAATAGLGWQTARRDPVRAVLAGLGASHRTGVGERREAVLADGTRLWLDTDTVVDARFDGALRLLVLHQGAILVDTHADDQRPPRPFVVRSREGAMRALGTRFAVRQLAGRTRLGVSEGRVEVTPVDAPSSPKVVAAGQETSFSPVEMSAPDPLAPTRDAWTRGTLVADDLPLERFLAELSRYRRGHLGCDPSIAGLRVVGGFPLGDTDRALAMLEAALPVRVRAVLPWWVTVEARDGAEK